MRVYLAGPIFGRTDAECVAHKRLADAESPSDVRAPHSVGRERASLRLEVLYPSNSELPTLRELFAAEVVSICGPGADPAGRKGT